MTWRAAPNVHRRPGTLVGTLMIIQNHREEPDATRVVPSRPVIKGWFFLDFVVFEGVEIRESALHVKHGFHKSFEETHCR